MASGRSDDPSAGSEAILAAAAASLADQRAGGRRRGGGRSAARPRRRHRHRRDIQRWDARRRVRIVLGMGMLLVLAGVLNFVLPKPAVLALVLLAVLLAVVVNMAMSSLSAPRVPARATLAQGKLSDLAGQVALWLEAQRPLLPAAAADRIDRIGARLDTLQPQLARLDENQPAAQQVRRLIGEDMPGLVAAYTEIPVPLRDEKRAGASADEHLVDSLARIDTEVETITRQLAEGAIDRLAIQSRYLDLKYGGDVSEGG